MYKLVNFFRRTNQLPSLSTHNITRSGEDGTSAPPPTPIEGPIPPREEKEKKDEIEEQVKEDRFVWGTTSTSMEDGDFICLNTPHYKPVEEQFFCSSDLDSLTDRYSDIHELPGPHDERFKLMLNYLGWHMPSSELVTDSLKWALIMKIRASLENELIKWGFQEIHHVSNSDNLEEYVVHALYRGPMPENLPSYFFRIKYVCMYFGGSNTEHLGNCECQGLAAEYEADTEENAHTDSETGGKAGSEAENKSGAEPEAQPKAQSDTKPEVKSKIFSDPAREEGQQSQQAPEMPEALQRRLVNYFNRVIEVQQQQALELEKAQQPDQPQEKAQAQSSQGLTEDRPCVHASQKCQGLQLPLQAQTSPGTAPSPSPLHQSQPTLWSASLLAARLALAAREETRRQLPSTHWDPAAILGTLPAHLMQQQQTTPHEQYGHPSSQSGGAMCGPSVTGGLLGDRSPGVTHGLLRDRPDIGNMDEYLEKRYGARYGNRRT